MSWKSGYQPPKVLALLQYMYITYTVVAISLSNHLHSANIIITFIVSLKSWECVRS